MVIVIYGAGTHLSGCVTGSWPSARLDRFPPSLGGFDRDEPANRATLLRDDYRTRPPCAKLLMRRSHALPTYLTMVYVAQTEVVHDSAGRNNRRCERNAG